MPLDAPFRLGPFIVDVQGRLQLGDSDRLPNFHVAWRGCPVHVRLVDGGGSDGAGLARLLVSAIVGRVPSTAGGDTVHNGARRLAALGALRGLRTDEAEPTRLRLLPDHRLAVEATRPVDVPLSAGDLVTQITCFLLGLGPYLDLLAEADVPVEPVAGARPPGRGGTVKI